MMLPWPSHRVPRVGARCRPSHEFLLADALRAGLGAAIVLRRPLSIGYEMFPRGAGGQGPGAWGRHRGGVAKPSGYRWRAAHPLRAGWQYNLLPQRCPIGAARCCSPRVSARSGLRHAPGARPVRGAVHRDRRLSRCFVYFDLNGPAVGWGTARTVTLALRCPRPHLGALRGHRERACGGAADSGCGSDLPEQRLAGRELRSPAARRQLLSSRSSSIGP